jgi:hypothetical protein
MIQGESRLNRRLSRKTQKVVASTKVRPWKDLQFRGFVALPPAQDSHELVQPRNFKQTHDLGQPFACGNGWRWWQSLRFGTKVAAPLFRVVLAMLPDPAGPPWRWRRTIS